MKDCVGGSDLETIGMTYGGRSDDHVGDGTGSALKA
jgi:hypothetical protein